jgi:hypothetical protein
MRYRVSSTLSVPPITHMLTTLAVRLSAPSTTASSVRIPATSPSTSTPTNTPSYSRSAHGSCQVQRIRRLRLPRQLQDPEQCLPQAPRRPPHPCRATSQVQDAGQPRVPAVDKALLGPALPWYAHLFFSHTSLHIPNILPSQVVTTTLWPVEKVKSAAQLPPPLPEHPPQGAPPPSPQPRPAQEHALP